MRQPHSIADRSRLPSHEILLDRDAGSVLFLGLGRFPQGAVQQAEAIVGPGFPVAVLGVSRLELVQVAADGDRGEEGSLRRPQAGPLQLLVRTFANCSHAPIATTPVSPPVVSCAERAALFGN